MGVELIRRGQSSVYGQVSDVVVKGLSLKNELNYNRETWEEWSRYGTVIADSMGLEFTSNGTTSNYARLNIKVKPDTKYGFLYNVLYSNIDRTFSVTSGDGRPFNGNLPVNVGNNKIMLISRSDITSNVFDLYLSSANTEGTKIKITDLRLFEIPPTSQIESDFETLTADQLAQKYPYIKGDSVKSTVNARLVSVGKNLFNKSKPITTSWSANKGIENSTGFTVNGTTESTTGFINFDLKLEPNTVHAVKVNSTRTGTTGGGIVIRDSSGVTIAGNANTLNNSFSFTVPSDGIVQVTFYAKTNDATVQSATFTNIQIEKGSTATTYEPYKESIVNVNLPEPLRSLPNGVKDEINVTTGVKTQRNKEHVLEASDIIRMYTLYTSIDYAELIKPTDFIGYGNASANIGAITIPGYTTSAAGGVWDSVDNVGKIYCGASHEHIWIGFPKGTTLADAQTALAGTTLTYQLANPIVTYQDPTPIQLFPNGTRWVELASKETATYNAGIQVSNTAIPIKEMIKVDKIHIEDGHWKRTAIDLANVTVAGDGLSFTVTGAVDGELYEFEYYYDSALSTLPELVIPSEPSQITYANRCISL